MNRTKLFLLVAALLCARASANSVIAQTAYTASPAATIDWKESLKQRPEWYASDEAVRIADNVLLYQRDAGGWPKNIDMARRLTESERAALLKERAETDSTIDNGATYTQLVYLARVYTAKRLERHRDAFLKGVDYLLKAQYSNGGWPQYYPPRKGYYTHITFNDDAMINVMRLLRDVAQKRPNYLFVDESRRRSSEQAVAKGVDLILKTQVVEDGVLTVWGAQYDEVTLQPTDARKFEPASLASRESVGITRFLMMIDHSDKKVVEAVEAAIAWFEKSKLTGIRWVEKPDPSKAQGFDRVVVKDPTAPALWARFYELHTNRPIFIGRDSVIKYDVSEIEAERRNGYGWYTEEPLALITKDYPAWRQRWRR